MTYHFLEKYKLVPEQVNTTEARSIGRMNHYFFPVPEIDIYKGIMTFNPFPIELEIFYKEIGFGFLYRRKGDINCLLDPMSVININLQLGYNKEDPFIKDAIGYTKEDKYLLFFKTASNKYFSINRKDDKGKNAVFFKGKKIHASLYEFLSECNDDSDYFTNLDYNEESNMLIAKKKENIPPKKDSPTKKRIGGHIIIDPY